MELKLVLVSRTPYGMARCVVIAERLRRLLSDYMRVRILTARAEVAKPIIIFDDIGFIECEDPEEAMERAMEYLEQVGGLGALDVASGATREE